jgi:hypothetical protein
MREPVPLRLIAAIDNAPAVSNRAGSSIVSTLGDHLRNLRESIGWWGLAAPIAVAAMLVAVMPKLSTGPGVGPGTEIGGGAALVREAQGGRLADGVLLAALEKAPSQASPSSVPANGAAAAHPVASFLNTAQRYCREYRATDQTGASFAGVACRQQGGEWQVLQHQAVNEPAAGGDGMSYKPAGRDAPPELDAAIEEMRASDVLSVDAEKRLIADGWTGAAP